MSVYFSKGRGWRYDFILKGQRYHASGYKTKVEARNAEAEKRKELKEKENKPHQQTRIDMDFLELVNKRLDYVQAYNSKSHYQEMKYMAKRWVKAWGKKKSSEVTPEMIQQFILKRARVSNHVANKEIRYLRALFNFAKKWKWLRENPLDGFEFLPVDKKLKHVPIPEDIEKVINQADPDTQDYLWTIRDTMARVSEVNRLTWDDVNLQDKYVVLYTRKKKGGNLTPRKIPMTSRLFKIMEKRFNGRDTTKKWVFWHTYYDRKERRFVAGPFKDRKKVMATLCRKAGVKYFRYHALRHSGASVMDGLKIPIGSIQRILGHENRTTTEIYLHSISDSERVAMDIFEKGFPEKVPPEVPHIIDGDTDYLQ